MYDFAGEQLAQAKAYSEGFKAQIRAINQTGLAEAGSRSNDEYTVYDDSGNNGTFEISTGIINGNITLTRSYFPFCLEYNGEVRR